MADLGFVEAPIGDGGSTVSARVIERFETGAVLVRHAGQQWLVQRTCDVVKKIGRGKADQEGLQVLRHMSAPKELEIVPASYESAMAIGVLGT